MFLMRRKRKDINEKMQNISTNTAEYLKSFRRPLISCFCSFGGTISFVELFMYIFTTLSPLKISSLRTYVLYAKRTVETRPKNIKCAPENVNIFIIFMKLSAKNRLKIREAKNMLRVYSTAIIKIRNAKKISIKQLSLPKFNNIIAKTMK